MGAAALDLWALIAACAVALAAFYATRRNLFAGVSAGAIALSYARRAL